MESKKKAKRKWERPSVNTLSIKGLTAGWNNPNKTEFIGLEKSEGPDHSRMS